MKQEIVKCSCCGKRNVFFKQQDHSKRPARQMYPKFAPGINGAEADIEGTQICQFCGYSYPHIGEDVGVKKSYVKSDTYQNPFSELFLSDDIATYAVRAYRIGNVLETYSKSYVTAAKYYVRAAVLLDSNEAARQKCLLGMFLNLNKAIQEGNMELEVEIARLNCMRMMKMFDSAIKLGDSVKIRCDNEMDYLLVEKILELCEKKNSKYMTYLEMLSDG